jgi:sulfate transport system ATP-binding protein
MHIRTHNITKSFGDFDALKNVTLDVPPGELVALLGPSGSGKTTLLRVIAGLESADSGIITYGDSDVTRISARERNVGFVFQHYALFNHMTIFENIAFGLRVRKWKNPDVTKRVRELLQLIQLASLENRYPSQLSGGQRQRVALARALAAQPQVLLLDEPFGALDAKVRQELRSWLRRLHDEIHMTSVFVTHDQEEAFEVADRVVVMNKGRIEQVGSPDEIFAEPANAFVMDFLGGVNIFPARVQNGAAFLGKLRLPFPEYTSAEPHAAQVFVRTRDLQVERAPLGSGAPSSLQARVTRINHVGPSVKLGLLTSGVDGNDTTLEADLDRDHFADLDVSVDEFVLISPRRARIFLDERAA